MKYSLDSFTYGYEVELGDIPRKFKIPKHLGAWEYAETDIVNLIEPYRGIACDPLGLKPPVGGEINTKPTARWQEQVDRILEIINLFETPTTSCVNHGHVHVNVKGLKEDIEGLKNLTRYIQDNQMLTIKALYQFKEDPLMKQTRTAKTYLKWDGGRPLPEWMANNIIEKANNFDDFILMHCCGKDGKSRGRPFRYAINMYCMKHINTIEFRCFRASMKTKHIEDQFKFVEKFLDSALNGGANVKEILDAYNYEFPPFIYNHNMYLGWERTKYGKDRGKKVRHYYGIP